MNDFEYEIAGITNMNTILPRNGNWYYTYLNNGNIKVYGSPSNANDFSPKTFEQKILAEGARIQLVNNLTNKNQEKMADTATEELIKIEQGIETVLEEISEKELENTYLSIVLTSSNSIPTPNTNFQKNLTNHLGSKMNDEIRSKIKLKLEQIKKSLKSGTVTEAVFTLPTCKPVTKDTTITIKDEDYVPGSLEITIETTIAEVKCSSSKSYPISGDKFSSQDIINALTEFSAGRTFLKGLTTSLETFTPST
ncbi:hypothetical protein [Tenacibaculum ovolyticum]|uniref:hypothetical protein n=1 Tax=Tenacibaculum ovolyticum TaxID=104270 RepID=UPI000418A7B8|nr:hypothetical protein [Tenacibaculum ovolyticum]